MNKNNSVTITLPENGMCAIVRKINGRYEIDTGRIEGKDIFLGPQPDPDTGLVPCGCGGKAVVKKGVNHRSGYYVICEKCECNIGLDRDDYLRPYGAYPTEEQAISDWNTAMNYTAPPRPGAKEQSHES